MNTASDTASPGWHGTTILAVRKNGRTVIAGDGQVSMGPTIVKGAARKVRTLANGRVLAGFAGATADAFTLIERLEAKLEQYPDQLARACVDLAKDWRTDRYLTRGARVMIHERKMDKTLHIAGPLTTCIASVKAMLNELEHSIAIQNEGFENLVRGSAVTMDEVLRRAPENWYIEAQEAKALGLVADVL